MSLYSQVRGGGFAATIDARRVGRALGAFPVQFGRRAKRAFVKGGVVWEREMKMDFVGYSGVSGATLQNRSGNLRRTVQYRVEGDTLRKLSLVLQAGDNRTPYALAQEYGAVITPVNGSYLTVPMDDALTPSGVIRGDALIRGGGDDYYTDRGPTSIIEVNGTLFVTDGGEDGEDPRFLYVLKDEVVIPGPESDGSESRLGANRKATMMVNEDLVFFLLDAVDDTLRGSL